MSRLVNHEKQFLMKQSFFFIALALGLGIAFMFLVLPFYIKILASRNLSSKLAVSDLSVPPSRPLLEQSYVATYSATIDLKGSAQAGMKVFLLQNGAPVENTQTEEDGSFIFGSVSMQDGENVFTAVAENEKEERSNPSSEVKITFSKDAPKLEISEPAENATITQRKQNPLTIKGLTTAGSRVFVNEQMLFVNNDGNFSGSVQLVDGENKIAVKAINATGLETIKELMIRFLP